MKNLKKLCLILSVGSIAALSITACGDDATDPVGTAGKSAGGSGGSGTAGSGTAGSVTAGTSTGGSTAGAATGGAGGKGGAGGSGGASAGAGGKGGAGGSGGAGGGGGSGGGGAASAACTTWCSGDKGLPKKCMGSNLLNAVVDSEQKCLDYCAKPAAAAGLACWQKHLNFINGAGDQAPHCGHASGKAPDNGECTAIAP